MAELPHRHYKTPPILEAVSEFHFADSAEWDLTVPGRYYDLVRERYPGKPRNQAVVEAEIQAGADGRSLRLKESAAKIQFPSDDESRLLAIGPNVLSVHIKGKYEGWDEDFKPRITEALAAYHQVATPKLVRRVGVRYINRLVIPGTHLELERFFNIAPRRATGLPVSILNFLSRIELACDQPDTKLLITFAQLPANPDDSRFLLDLDAIWESESPQPVGTAVSIADTLKGIERSAFEATITDSLREVLDA